MKADCNESNKWDRIALLDLRKKLSATFKTHKNRKNEVNSDVDGTGRQCISFFLDSTKNSTFVESTADNMGIESNVKDDMDNMWEGFFRLNYIQCKSMYHMSMQSAEMDHAANRVNGDWPAEARVDQTVPVQHAEHHIRENDNEELNPDGVFACDV
eukprot:14058114-Ditylum_brightwellii.AAC.1